MSDDKKVALPQFTEIQNNLMELHDKLFPNSGTITAEDAAFMRNVTKKALTGKVLHEAEECDKVVTNLRAALNVAKESLKCLSDMPNKYFRDDERSAEATEALAKIAELEK